MKYEYDTSVYFSNITGQLVVYKGNTEPQHFGRLSCGRKTLTLSITEARALITLLLGYEPEEKC